MLFDKLFWQVIVKIILCKIIVRGLLYYLIFYFFINLGFLTPTWDFLEHNLGTSRKKEWKHC